MSGVLRKYPFIVRLGADDCLKVLMICLIVCASFGLRGDRLNEKLNSLNRGLLNSSSTLGLINAPCLFINCPPSPTICPAINCCAVLPYQKNQHHLLGFA